MKILLSLTILFNLLFANPNENEIQLGTYTFKVIKESYDEYGDKGVTLMLYDKGADEHSYPAFSFTLENRSGSCADKRTQKGAYEVVDGKLKLYSHWARYGRAYDAPIGDRIQVYSVDENGTFVLDYSQVYIEKTRRNKEAEVGMQYLYTEAKTSEEKRALSSYIGSVERIFEAKFVLDDDAKKLALKVEQAIDKKRYKRWK